MGRQLGVDASAWQDSLPPHLREQVTLLLPVHRDEKLAWYVACGGPKPDRSQLGVATLHAAVNAARDRFDAMKDAPEDKTLLSRQEAACLRWIGTGKTDVEISVIMKIAPRTVRFHIGNAKRKLGVHTRLQAVAARMRPGGALVADLPTLRRRSG